MRLLKSVFIPTGLDSTTKALSIISLASFYQIFVGMYADEGCGEEQKSKNFDLFALNGHKIDIYFKMRKNKHLYHHVHVL